jgi:hypothetical protein
MLSTSNIDRKQGEELTQSFRLERRYVTEQCGQPYPIRVA